MCHLHISSVNACARQGHWPPREVHKKRKLSTHRAATNMSCKALNAPSPSAGHPCLERHGQQSRSVGSTIPQHLSFSRYSLLFWKWQHHFYTVMHLHFKLGIARNGTTWPNLSTNLSTESQCLRGAMLSGDKEGQRRLEGAFPCRL